MKIISTELYSSERKVAWDDFVDKSINAPFFFKRDFMEYHADRFTDFSVILSERSRIAGVIPASIVQDSSIVVSHQGLTFGGMAIDKDMTTPLFLKCFESFLVFLRREGICKLIYKAIPHFYHQYPAAEEYYAAFKFGGKLIGRDVGSVMTPQSNCGVQKRRARMINKARSNNITFSESDDLDAYWHILSEVLLHKHGAKPVHSLDEIKYLSTIFPGNIRLFASFQNDIMVSGVLVFESKYVAHCQYIASSATAREVGALDLVFDCLINEIYKDKKVFSFGKSTEKDGSILNEGLITQKEGFGARATIFDTYEFTLA